MSVSGMVVLDSESVSLVFLLISCPNALVFCCSGVSPSDAVFRIVSVTAEE